jgi:hypothetical protein
MSVIKSNGAGEQSTGFYNRVATTSFRNQPTTTLTRDYGASPTSTKTMSFGGWIKRARTGFYQNVLSSTLGGGGVAQGYIFINASDVIAVQDLVAGGSTTFSYITNRVIRDVSSWYHLWVRIDTTDSTSGDRVQLWVNGVRETSFSTSTAPSLNADTVALNQNKTHFFGHSDDAGVTTGYGGHVYLADWYWLDGSSVSPVDTVGEFKNGIFIPKSYSSASFGNKGWHLKFDQTGVGSPSTSTIGADSSGNTNHWTSTANTNVEAHDCAMPDSPENNFATLNPLIKPHDALTFSEGNLKISRGSGSLVYSFAASTIAVKTGKWYAEWRPQDTITAANHMVGISTVDNPDQSTGDPYLENGQINYVANGSGHVDDGGNIGASTFSSSNSYGAGDVVGIALDLDSGTKTVKFYKNGSLVNTTNLSSEFDDKHIYFMVVFYNTNTGMFNFGQDSTFAGQTSAGGNTDGNGIGDFAYAPPSGYLALCTSNLPEPTISPNADTQADDHFNTVIYNGSNSSQTITTGLQPDWIWIKVRSLTGYHNITDTSRGITKELYANTTDDEENNSRVSSTSSTGFTLAGGYGYTNEAGQTFVSWNWHANGGTTSTNNDGSGTSTVQVNTTAGFSIVLYTGNATGAGAEQTIGHGLGVKPDWILFKARDYDGQNWYSTHVGLAGGVETHIELDTDAAEHADGDYMNRVAPTSSVFSLGYNFTTNKNGNAYVAYCFNSVEGYSKFGSYSGNGNADGTFVYTGFRPAWLMVKLTSGSGENWHIFDNKRATFNVMKARLIADGSTAENNNDNILDFTSNGFKWRDNNAGYNGNGNSYIFMCFADDPFKYANAR